MYINYYQGATIFVTPKINISTENEVLIAVIASISSSSSSGTSVIDYKQWVHTVINGKLISDEPAEVIIAVISPTVVKLYTCNDQTVLSGVLLLTRLCSRSGSTGGVYCQSGFLVVVSSTVPVHILDMTIFVISSVGSTYNELRWFEWITSFEPSHTKICRRVWPVCEFPKKVCTHGKKICVYFTYLPRSLPFADLHEILHEGSSRRRNQPCQILSQSDQGFWFCAGSNFWLSHRKDKSPLTHGLNYRSVCDVLYRPMNIRNVGLKPIFYNIVVLCIEPIIKLVAFR